MSRWEDADLIAIADAAVVAIRKYGADLCDTTIEEYDGDIGIQFMIGRYSKEATSYWLPLEEAIAVAKNIHCNGTCTCLMCMSCAEFNQADHSKKKCICADCEFYNRVRRVAKGTCYLCERYRNLQVCRQMMGNMRKHGCNCERCNDFFTSTCSCFV